MNPVVIASLLAAVVLALTVGPLAGGVWLLATLPAIKRSL